MDGKVVGFVVVADVVDIIVVEIDADGVYVVGLLVVCTYVVGYDVDGILVVGIAVDG